MLTSSPLPVAVFVALSSAAILPPVEGEPVVLTDKGLVTGIRERVGSAFIDMFFGIPYASPPLGYNRFKHPQPMPAWRGKRDATRKPNACMQGFDRVFGDHPGPKVWNPNTPVSEDCLYLNVWRPTNADYMARKAVMVWIYGGSFLSGSASLEVYDARYLASKMDVIVVSMQYRIGSLGFLSLAHPEAPGNAGMMDQVMALDWVQRNIQAFGGDPRNITIFGESSGGASVGMHLLSPLSRNKFNRAILQSGSPLAPWATLTQEEATRRSKALARGLNCSRETSTETLECLRTVPANLFPGNEFNPDIVRGIIEFPFVPVVDGTFLPFAPDVALQKDHFKQTDILVGSNINEGTWFLIYHNEHYFSLNHDSLISRDSFRLIMDDLFQYFPQYPQKLNAVGKNAIHFQYTPWKNPDNERLNRDGLESAVGDLNFICPVVFLAEKYLTCNASVAGCHVFYYEFNHRSSAHLWPEWMGILHGDEINFVFGEPFNPHFNYTDRERELSLKMMKYWTNFAKTGDPNKETLDSASSGEWPLHTAEERLYLRLDHHLLSPSPSDPGKSVRSGPRIKHCAFWRDYLPGLILETANMSDMEREWKILFHEWKTKYIVDWKNQFEDVKNIYNRLNKECGRH